MCFFRREGAYFRNMLGNLIDAVYNSPGGDLSKGRMTQKFRVKNQYPYYSVLLVRRDVCANCRYP